MGILLLEMAASCGQKSNVVEGYLQIPTLDNFS
jgi:hypothetical protein